MKILKISLPMLFICFFMTSCQKFVDVKKSSSQSLLTTASDCQQLLDNYTVMNTGYPVDGEISADDYYIISESTFPTVNPKITNEDLDFYAWRPNAKRAKASPNWQNPYYITYNANLVLQALDKITAGTEDPVLMNTLRGSALFYRAYTLWFVAQLYAKPYSANTAAQDPGVPIRLTQDINAKSSRGTVQETYNRIIQDLKEGLNLLPTTSSIATRPNKIAAYAMLSRVYLSMEDYPNALINADAALQLKKDLLDYNSISKTSTAPFQRYNKEVIFQSLANTAPILTPNVASNNIAKINSALANSYATNDLRRQIFLKANTGTVHGGTFRFSGNYEPSGSTSVFFNGLAVDELYLTRAECYARAGNGAAAATDLNTLLKTRWLTGTYTDIPTVTPADQMLSKVLEERRKELLMRGLRWTDLRRLNKDPNFKKDISRNFTLNGVPVQTYTLPANDPRYTLLIPDEVINTTGMAQNER